MFKRLSLIFLMAALITNQNTTTREYQEIHLTMEIPEDFDNKVITKYDIEYNRYVFFTTNNEYLASIMRARDFSFADIVPSKIIREDDGNTTEINYASDVQYSEETEKTYHDTLDLLNDVFDTIEFDDTLIAKEKYIGYINNIDIHSGTIDLDPAEFISINDVDRRKELQLVPEHGPNVYNEERENKEYKLSKDCKFYLREIDGFVQSAHEVDYYTFINELNAREMKPPFWVKFDGNTVVELVEIYIKSIN